MAHDVALESECEVAALTWAQIETDHLGSQLDRLLVGEGVGQRLLLDHRVTVDGGDDLLRVAAALLEVFPGVTAGRLVLPSVGEVLVKRSSQ